MPDDPGGRVRLLPGAFIQHYDAGTKENPLASQHQTSPGTRRPMYLCTRPAAATGPVTCPMVDSNIRVKPDRQLPTSDYSFPGGLARKGHAAGATLRRASVWEAAGPGWVAGVWCR
ncbi:hypothetical protein GCM10010298_70230 [Streptomyces microflavus]|uniref:Uncharacterized protein n=1 Tax=Streptomyces microflavus TaxID=1919 RepID=A0A7J0D4U9_STRMI|nr:hypothetical protein Smic_83190 [Streptomyces microflavus]GGX94763.1 hypothetical protein GCM10010298_70230 [Streptomyces microflavus]